MVRVLVQRAASGRHSLLELVSVLPGGYLERQATDDDWPAHVHLGHALTSDALVADFVRLVHGDAGSDELGVHFASLAAGRIAAIDSAIKLPLPELLDLAADAREALVGELQLLAAGHLEFVLPVPGVRDAWGQPLGVSVLSYLQQWANHDSGHESAVRRAIATNPDLSTVALTRRLR
ncbi:MAG: hypothetical protein ABI577_02685 [bacterium]